MTRDAATLRTVTETMTKTATSVKGAVAASVSAGDSGSDYVHEEDATAGFSVKRSHSCNRSIIKLMINRASTRSVTYPKTCVNI